MTTISRTQDPVENRQRRQSRTKRANVFWAIGWFLLLQISLAAGIQTRMIKLDDGTTYAAKAERFRQQLNFVNDDPFIALAFGSSRIMNGFDAGSLVKPISEVVGRRTVAYNFGISGCGNIYSYLALEKLLAEGITPDLVLVEVYPIFLVKGAEREWFEANEMRSKNFEHTERYGIKNVTRAWHEQWLVPWHTHRFCILNRFAPKLLPMKLRENWAQQSDQHGWVSVDKPLQPKRLEQQVKGFVNNVAHFRLGGDSCRALKDTISLCQQNNIECALVWMPECKAIRDGYHAEMKSEINDLLDEVQQEFAVQIVNARDWIEDSGFYDSCHLNREGAIQFTQQLSKRALPVLSTRAVARSRGDESTRFR